MDETHLKVWQPPAPFVGTSTSRSTFEALRHEVARAEEQRALQHVGGAHQGSEDEAADVQHA